MDQYNSGLIKTFEEYLAQIFYEDYGRILMTEDPSGYKFWLEQF
jgi:hypothetical protein